ncbi:inositol monophosphatase family protein [Propionibacterium freudenreichii]|uniref:inositol monophosphatase family protein n=1 Tax=Propionibacterium freudenreichii TaxID=1744 RepID=UPI000541E966|nr:inositol monophosphatase family protein [Propionibacterium freudenreichii]MCT2972991.1 inositol monophosphatase family protein [Propionibacterium freudenreichii]MCT2978177.1 inositol monophosphatase family protein [Propionibacterium freudenreichii]MCT2986661.1 inositol monophosphatase family protein [Propionibacterium freudenreichii]MDK9295999.1 inositol monophosphatase family protein [Propionibacterium freudenreichii]MDK9361391.1 inositol monophosphatase family protein [Propionibacterium f
MSEQLDIKALLAIAEQVVRRASAMALAGQQRDLQVQTKANRNDLVTRVDKDIEEFVAAELTSRTGYPVLGEEGHGVDSFAGRVWVVDPIDGTMNYVETRRDYAVSLALVSDGQPLIGVVADVVAGRLYSAVRGHGATCHQDERDWTRSDAGGPPTEPGRSTEELAQVPSDKGFRDSIIITDLKEIRAMPRLVAALVESRGHRRYGSAALECLEVASGRAGAFVHLWVSPWDIAAAMVICAEAGVTVTRLDGTPLDVRHKGSILAGAPRAHAELLARLVSDPTQ